MISSLAEKALHSACQEPLDIYRQSGNLVNQRLVSVQLPDVMPDINKLLEQFGRKQSASQRKTDANIEILITDIHRLNNVNAGRIYFGYIAAVSLWSCVGLMVTTLESGWSGPDLSAGVEFLFLGQDIFSNRVSICSRV